MSLTQTRWSDGQLCNELKIIAEQVGHRFASTTAIYTAVSGDRMNAMMRNALDRAFAAEQEWTG